MSLKYLNLSGLEDLWINIKNYILSKVPTKTSELTNDSGYLTSHQSLDNYVTLNTAQTVTGKKLFTASAIQLDNVTSMSGSTMFINTSASAPRGAFPENDCRVGRVYIGDGTSYNGAWFIVDPIISTNKAVYRMVTTNPDNTDSTRFSITWDSTKEGARRRRLVCMGDLICATNNTYQIGESGNVWKDAYINKIHGISDYTNFLVKVLNYTTTLTHAVSGRRTVVCEGDITLTLPTPEEGSWFHIKATTGSVLLNFANGVSVSGVDGIPITLKPNESILLCYYTASSYVAFCNFKRCGVIGRTGTAPSEPKNWFKVAECTLTETYIDPFICLRVFESTTGNTIGTLCAHCRINNTVGVVDTSNCYLQWQDAGAGIDLSKYALTTNETSGTGVTITIWCTLVGGYSSLKFEVVTECKRNDYPNDNTWKITRDRQADGDLAELSDTDFTKIVYSTLTTLKNDTTGKASNVTGTVAIANGGTGATTRLNAVKNLTNESVGTPTHFLAITTNWGKAGYTTVAQAKTVLGITGDIVSHNASEFLTSHQSLSSCVKNVVTNSQTIKSTAITRGTAPSSAQTFGIAFSDNNNKYIGNIYGQYATDKSTYVGLYAYKGTTTANSDNVSVRVGYDASGNAYTYAPTPATADNSTQIATTAFVKAQGYLTSHQSLANYALDANVVHTSGDETIAGKKSFNAMPSILGSYLGNEYSTNARTCLYLKSNRDTDGKSGIYFSKFRQNRAQGALTGSDLVDLSLDVLENSVRTNSCISISFRYFENDVPTKIYVIPKASVTSYMGTANNPWTNAYIKNLNLNGNAFDPTSIDGVGTVKLLAYLPTSSQEYTMNAGTIKAGSNLGEVWAFHANDASVAYLNSNMSITQSGTWKLLNFVSVGGNPVNCRVIGLWVRIA